MPSLILPIVTVASNMVHFVLSLPILAGLLLLSGIPITHTVLALPFLIVVEFVFILSCAYPIATIHVWFRDIQHVVRVGLQLFFYLTPVFYLSSSVPERVRPFYRVDPMAHLVDAYRAILIQGTWPNPMSLVYLIAVSSVLLVIGITWFRHASHLFADEL